MLKQIKNNWFSGVLVLIFVGALVCVRAFEQQLFVDPFVSFFKGQYNQKPTPNIDYMSLSVNYFFRYVLNSILSLSIIFVIFKNWNQIKFASILYAVFFVILLSLLLVFISFDNHNYVMVIFYIRRFIIQPLFLILFMPAFYYQKLLQKGKV